MDAPRCTEHTQVAAAWGCEPCARSLCAACAAPGAAAGLVICARCGHLVERLQGPRAALRPYRDALPGALRPLVQPLGLAVAALVTAVGLYLAQWGPRGWLAGQGVVAAWVVVVLRRAAAGFPPVAVPTWDDFIQSWLGVLPRLLPLAPLAVGAAWVSGGGQRAVAPTDGVAWLLALAAAAIAPAALVGASVEGDQAGLATPWRLLDVERRLRGDVAPLHALAAVAAGLQLGYAWLAPLDFQADTALMAHELVAFGAHLALNLTLAAAAVAAGHLLFTHAAAFDHGDALSFEVPYLPEAQPTGAWTRPVDPAAAAAQAQRHQPLELEDPAALLRAALDGGDAAQAIARAAAHDVPFEVLTSSQHLTLAQMLAGRGDPAGAAAGLRELLLRRPDDPVASRAMVVLARLCAERLDDAAEAQRLYRAVAARFPGTDAARFAAQRLVPRHRSFDRFETSHSGSD